MNKILLDKLHSMDDAALYAAIFTDSLTGALNRRAFELTGVKAPCLALVDLDSLKFINDYRGYRAGDEHLMQLSEALHERFGKHRVYRLSGDEFTVTGLYGPELTEEIVQVRKNFPFFSFGVARDMKAADLSLKADKAARLLSGERARRGMQPPWVDTKIAKKL